MYLLITLLMLAFAQLFFNVAAASPHAPVNASLHNVEKKSVREDERRKRRPVKHTTKKPRQTTTEKSKQKKPVKKVTTLRTASRKTSRLKSPVRKIAQRHSARRTHSSNEKAQALTGITMSKSHRQRYQKARETAMNKLMRQLGKPYQWGGTSPNTGFDCSGLVWYAYKDLVKYKFPRTANEMYHLHDAATIKRELLEKGDLVFFRINRRAAADHVGVYLGNGKFIQSPRTGKGIQITALSENYWQKHYIGARRIMTPKTIR